MGRENYSGLRRSGKTSRQADEYIQLLFESETTSTKGTAIIRDHHDTLEADTRLMNIIVRRLAVEHPHVKVEPDWNDRKIHITSPKY